MLKNGKFSEPTAAGKGVAGTFYGMPRVESWGLTSKGQKTADEPLKHGETRRKPCPVKRPRKEEKK